MNEQDHLKTQIAAYENEIGRLTERLEGLHQAKESLEHRLSNLVREESGKSVVGMVIYPSVGMPRREALVWVTCKSCHRRTRSRTVSSGLEVAQCSHCALEAVGAELFGASDHSGAEAPQGVPHA